MKSNFNVQVTARPGKVGRVASWSVRIALALIFAATGATKILSVQQLVDGFAWSVLVSGSDTSRALSR